MTPFKTIKEMGEIRGRRILLRLDLNEPILDDMVQNDFRLRRSLKTIEFLRQKGARIIILAHAGEGKSLKIVAQYLNRFIKSGFVPRTTGFLVEKAVNNLKEGGILVLENLRLDKGEEKNDPAFTKKLAKLGDLYVNEAFSVSHRAHASFVGLPKILPSYGGFLFEEEYEFLVGALKPQKPIVFVLGGAKLDTKLPLLEKYLPLAENIFVVGGPANTFFRLKGYEIGRSTSEGNTIGVKKLLTNKKIILPLDVKLLSGKVVSPEKISAGDKIVDVGPRTIEELKNKISKAKTVIFNGPLGIYEEGFSAGTEELLKILAKSSAKTIIGGGDTVTLITKLNLENKFTFVSTGGGAMLEFLAKGTLPGIEALKGK